jgi:hypothetical protein
VQFPRRDFSEFRLCDLLLHRYDYGLLNGLALIVGELRPFDGALLCHLADEVRSLKTDPP